MIVVVKSIRDIFSRHFQSIGFLSVSEAGNYQPTHKTGGDQAAWIIFQTRIIVQSPEKQISIKPVESDAGPTREDEIPAVLYGD